ARGAGRLRVRVGHLRPQRESLATLGRVAATGTFQSLISTASWIGLVRILSGFGSNAIAGYTIGIRLIVFALMPSFGLANAAATMVGQNLGAAKPERAAQAVWRAGFYNMLFLGVSGAVFALLAEPIVRGFSHDPAVLPIGADCLRIVSYGLLF